MGINGIIISNRLSETTFRNPCRVIWISLYNEVKQSWSMSLWIYPGDRTFMHLSKENLRESLRWTWSRNVLLYFWRKQFLNSFTYPWTLSSIYCNSVKHLSCVYQGIHGVIHNRCKEFPSNIALVAPWDFAFWYGSSGSLDFTEELHNMAVKDILVLFNHNI